MPQIETIYSLRLRKHMRVYFNPVADYYELATGSQ
jgi:hypothetical protein